jgi:putative FmdB family regulatory protein
MPTYDYQCDACDHRFELFQWIKESPIKKCPECGKLKLRRLFGTGAAVVFKGSGFYQTDYRSESYQKRAAEDKKSSETPAPAPDGKATEKRSADSKAADAKPKAEKPQRKGTQGS